jgi:hypothetical protein
MRWQDRTHAPTIRDLWLLSNHQAAGLRPIPVMKVMSKTVVVTPNEASVCGGTVLLRIFANRVVSTIGIPLRTRPEHFMRT